MRIIALFIGILFACGCSEEHGKKDSSPQPVITAKSKSRILTYKQEDPGKATSVLATDFGGGCNITVARIIEGQNTKETWNIPLDRFEKIWAGLSAVPSISSRRLEAHFTPFESTDYHLIMTIPDKKTYAIPESETNTAFREWLDFLMTKPATVNQ
jgi:hypothetical protein